MFHIFNHAVIDGAGKLRDYFLHVIKTAQDADDGLFVAVFRTPDGTEAGRPRCESDGVGGGLQPGEGLLSAVALALLG